MLRLSNDLSLSSVRVWPELEFNWRIVLATIIGFFGSAFGTVGGVGGGGIFVPMLNLIVGFDAKSAAALSKCMIMGASASSVWYNLRVAHPTKDVSILDYDLALLFQPMLMLGITIGVSLSVVFPYWLITILIIILFIGTSSRSFFKGVEMWKNETLIKVIQSFVQNDTVPCSPWYWVLNVLQFPVSLVVFAYEAVKLCWESQKRRTCGNFESVCEAPIDWTALQLMLCALCGVIGGTVGGLLGSGGGFILGPLLLELGVIPQVASATATFVMLFSSSLSVVEFYLLKRFPIPYALYLMAVSVIAGFWGQFFVRKLVAFLRRASIIVFILSAVIFVSALIMGIVGVERSISMINQHEYMGFLGFCDG
ncbi:hypothetical protein QJS04_geneDACA018554 [Acorus gramineus]|uniref:Sulfite exporter TauE/SafE family protein n=1 Tax=Acorus gramineus TaxID=55184 RepID=A0AAV8ZYA4_ACOGR|nr:hypothetical protein QJS04_geneDACA022920 [Acorus gramineus]KAK1279966.1 hypothetical protein QJS04_geneDACA018554 [Acorus gramineus]